MTKRFSAKQCLVSVVLIVLVFVSVTACSQTTEETPFLGKWTCTAVTDEQDTDYSAVLEMLGINTVTFGKNGAVDEFIVMGVDMIALSDVNDVAVTWRVEDGKAIISDNENEMAFTLTEDQTLQLEEAGFTLIFEKE